jgi:hypothetical protein
MEKKNKTNASTRCPKLVTSGYARLLFLYNIMRSFKLRIAAFSPTSENPRGFSVWCVLLSYVLNHATTHSRDRYHRR